MLEAVDGLEPKKELHESYFFIQPASGLPVDLAFRFQINMALQNIGHMTRVEKFNNLTLPMLWFEIVRIANINTFKVEFQDTFLKRMKIKSDFFKLKKLCAH